MADHVLFIGFGSPVRGREEGATKVFGEFVQYLTGQAQQARIESFDPVLLQPHGGDLGGFFLIRGEASNLSQLMASSEFQRLITRGQTIVEHFGVVEGMMGQALQRQMESFLPDTADLR